MDGMKVPTVLPALMAQPHALVSRKSFSAVHGPGLPAPTRFSQAMGWHGSTLLIVSCAMASLMPTDAWSQGCFAGNGAAACAALGNLSTLSVASATGAALGNAAIGLGGVETGVQQVSQGAAGTDANFNGGGADVVTVTNDSPISLTLSSTDALVIGLQAASIGGNGYAPVDDDNGGNGGGGNTVTATITANSNISISALSSTTFQNGVIGLLASSRGGDGGSAQSGVLDHYGGTGGSSADVNVISQGTVSLGTADVPLNGGSHAAWGVVAQSIGGRGGQHTKGPAASGDDPTGAGGNAGTATANVTGDVSVYWNPSSQDAEACSGSGALGVKQCSSVAAVVATSVGGTGGQVTWTDDQGGSGGHAAQVTVNVGSAATTTNIVAVTAQATLDDSAAIMAISAGGHGGGYGTNDATGGTGGNADGATATLTNTTVTTHGDSLSGLLVLAQGGDGGGEGNGPADDTIGGDGGSIANANNSPTNATLVSSAITTTGTASYGVLVQGIGGLGAIGSSQGGQGADGGYVTANLDSGSTVTTSGDYAAAVVTQSLAGAGGSGGAWTSWIDGDTGDGGIGGAGGAAGVSSYAVLGTTGQYSHGVLVQSIGGSGGTGATGTGVIALGGNGGSGNVSATVGGEIITAGTGSIGVVAQSIAGGGGNAGSASGVISVGGSGTGSSPAGAVDVALAGSVTTSAEAAIGVLGQSIGGGGGNAGSAIGVSAVGGTGGAGSNGGEVGITLKDNGSILTSGLYSHGAVGPVDRRRRRQRRQRVQPVCRHGWRGSACPGRQRRWRR